MRGPGGGPEGGLRLRYPWLWKALGWGMVVSVVALSLVPSPPVSAASHDKLGHALAYFLLMAWFVQLHRRRWPLALAFLGMGIALEYLQTLTGRNFEVMDMAADALGILLAWTLVRGRLALVIAWVDARWARS